MANEIHLLEKVQVVCEPKCVLRCSKLVDSITAEVSNLAERLSVRVQ